MLYLIIAFDGKDPEAPVRRARVREAHLQRARELKAQGQLLFGGPILDEAGNMVGSALVVDFPSRAELDAWLEADPYVTGGVWQEITIYPFRITV